jgi:hypothetical protein
MQVPISDRLFIDYLQCNHKAFLKLSGKIGVKTDFEKLRDENYTGYCRRARELLSKDGDIALPYGVDRTFKEIKKKSFSRCRYLDFQ